MVPTGPGFKGIRWSPVTLYGSRSPPLGEAAASQMERPGSAHKDPIARNRRRFKQTSKASSRDLPDSSPLNAGAMMCATISETHARLNLVRSERNCSLHRYVSWGFVDPKGIRNDVNPRTPPPRRGRPPQIRILPPEPPPQVDDSLKMRVSSILELDATRCHWPLGKLHEVAVSFLGIAECYSSTLARGPMAGALIGCPLTSNIEPWQGQSQQVSKLFQWRWQPT